MKALTDGLSRAAWPTGLAHRIGEVWWVLDHEQDIDADFLAIYGIDLRTYDMDGPRYFALAHRLTAYTGVMQARAEEEREKSPTPPSADAVAPTQARSADGPRDKSEVSLTAFRVQFPGLVSMAQG